MEAKNPLPQEATLAIKAVLALATINWIGAQLLGKPFLYCALSPLLSPLYITWGSVVLYCVAAYTALMLFRGRIYPTLCGAAIIIGIIELPHVLELVFRLGGSCG